MTQRMKHLAILSLALSLAGCRMPAAYFAVPIFQRQAEEIAFDTRHPELLPADRAHFAQALAEPVTVVNWEENVSSTWNILYATNRVSQPVNAPRRIAYGNGIQPRPEYGRCLVTLPDRSIELDAANAPDEIRKLPDWLQALTFRAANDTRDKVVQTLSTVDAVQPAATDAFFAELNALIDRSPQRDVLIFVHGFNVSYDEAVKRTAQIAADLPFNGAVVAYAWPSQGGVDNYKRDGEVVEQSLEAFNEFLLEFSRRVPRDVKTNILVHSMGNRLVQRALWHLPDEYTSPPRFTELVFAAPDVGIEEFRRNVRQAKKVAQRVTLYRSTNDSALIASMFKNGEERAGSTNAPVLIAGMDTIETAVVDASLLGHSYYGSNAAVMRDLFAIVKEHTPIEQRPWMKPQNIPFAEAPFWHITPAPEQLVWTWHFDETQPGPGQILPASGETGT